MDELNGILVFHRKSDADTLTALDGDGAGVIWTFAPSSPAVLLQSLRRLRRASAKRMRWTRKIHLRSQSMGKIDAVGICLLPDLQQHVYRLDNGELLQVKQMHDESVDAARDAFND